MSANGKKNPFPFSLYLYWRVSGSVYDLMRRQRRRLCKANMRRHQSFHHHGEPLRPKASLERGILRLLIAWHVSLGYVKALEMQGEVIIVLQSLEKMRLGYFWSVKSWGTAHLITCSEQMQLLQLSSWPRLLISFFLFFFFQGLACCLSEWKYFTWPQLMWWCLFHNPTPAVTPVVFVPICWLKIGCLKFHVNGLVTKI